ncbi:hypothetical protein [Cupriavidus necator]|uniref:hypothetical protein n=1 Tax=Cupriavidus necator TaxID=106590 RepID=UPI0030F40ED4
MGLSCECISNIEKLVAETISEKIGAPAEARCEAVGFSLGGEVGLLHLTNFKVTSEKKGWAKGKSIPVQASYCPFCGVASDQRAKGEPA